MTATRYFTYTNDDGTAQALARVGDRAAERVARGVTGWESIPTLYKLVFDCDLSWDEVDQATAAAFLDELGMDAHLLDEEQP